MWLLEEVRAWATQYSAPFSYRQASAAPTILQWLSYQLSSAFSLASRASDSLQGSAALESDSHPPKLSQPVESSSTSSSCWPLLECSGQGSP